MDAFSALDAFGAARGGLDEADPEFGVDAFAPDDGEFGALREALAVLAALCVLVDAEPGDALDAAGGRAPSP